MSAAVETVPGLPREQGAAGMQDLGDCWQATVGARTEKILFLEVLT